MSKSADISARVFSVAPMMDWTDRYDRYFLRLVSRHALLYSEMITAPAVIHGERDRLIGFDEAEHPLALQLGGSVPGELAQAARIGEDFGYDEINLNVGCPSDRAQSGRFGACLMAEPDLVAECVGEMRTAVAVPVTVKCRIGIDDQDEDSALDGFVDTVAAAGCNVFIVHARKAWLEGLSPKQNRDIPPLNYERVYRLKQRRPELRIVINGGIASLEEADAHLCHVDGVMLGRAAYQSPYMLAGVDRRCFGSHLAAPTRREVVERLVPYVEHKLNEGRRLSQITRHILGLFNNQPGARQWRRHLSENADKPGAGVSVIQEALALVEGTEEQGRARLVAAQ